MVDWLKAAAGFTPLVDHPLAFKSDLLHFSYVVKKQRKWRMARDTLGVLEFEVVGMLITKTKDAYGVSIAQALQERNGRNYSVGAIYTVLDRLEKKKFVSSEWGERTEERGGRRKRLYKLEASGRAAYARSAERYRQFNVGDAQPVGA